MQHLQLHSLNGSVKDLNRSIRNLQMQLNQLNQTVSKLESNLNKGLIDRLRHMDEKVTYIEYDLGKIKDFMM